MSLLDSPAVPHTPKPKRPRQQPVTPSWAPWTSPPPWGAAGHSFVVHGRPVPKGSIIARLIKGRAVATPDSRHEKWAREVARHAEAVVRAVRDRGDAWRPAVMLVPVHVTLTFALARPKRPASAVAPVVPPDIDKLARAVLDALVKGGMLADDGQVVELHVSKLYAGQGIREGVWIGVAAVG